MHVLWEKCSKYCNEEGDEGNMENGQNLQNDLDENLINGHYILSSILVVVLIIIFMTVPFQLGYRLFTPRVALVFLDYTQLLANPLFMFLFYVRNPHLRIYVWRNILHMPTVKPIENDVELELGPI